MSARSASRRIGATSSTSSGFGSPSASPCALIVDPGRAVARRRANRRPGDALFGLSLSVTIDLRCRSARTRPPRTCRGRPARAWPCRTRPSSSCGRPRPRRAGRRGSARGSCSGESVNAAVIRPAVATASACGSAPRTSHDMIHCALGSWCSSKNGRSALTHGVGRRAGARPAPRAPGRAPRSARLASAIVCLRSRRASARPTA